MRTTDTIHADLVRRLRAAGCVFAEDEADLLIAEAASPQDLETMTEQRVAGLPLEHIVGWVEFCGQRIAVDPGVFVPRQRTTFLVTQAIELVRLSTGADRRRVVVDLCCGSGAIGAVLATSLGEIELYAADIDPAAVACARRNLAAFQAPVYEGDLFDPLPATLRGRIDLLAANTPYVPHEEIATMPPEARLFEAPVALDGGSDGLDVQRALSLEAPSWLAPGGHVLVETSQAQAPVAAALFAEHGLISDIRRDDERGSTVVIATRAAASGRQRRSLQP